MLSKTDQPKNKIFYIADEILIELQKISSLARNKCFFCYKSLQKGKFSYMDGSGVLISCYLCIIRVAVTQIINESNEMKETDLSQIVDLVTKNYI